MGLRSNKHLGWIALVLLIGMEVLFLLADIMGHRLGCSDTRVAFFNQFYRFNALVEYGQIPLWTPFMTQGLTMSFFYVLGGAGFLFDAMLLMGGLLKHFDFLVLFQTAYLFIAFPFLIGVWLLSGRYFTLLSARVFVMLCVASGFIIYTQGFWLNFMYMVPLVLWLLHRFMDSGRWRWLFMAGYVYLTCIATSNLYLVPVSSLFVVTYFFADMLCRREYYASRFAALTFGRSFWACIAGIGMIAALLFMYVYLARDPSTVSGSFMRNVDGSVSLAGFLQYAANTNLAKWNELILRVSPALDFTLYMGMFALPCVLAALIFSRRCEARVWAWLTLVVFLLSIGSFLAVVLYFFWPLMKFYRHLCLLSPVVKLGLCFLAGFGFEAIFSEELRQKQDARLRGAFFIVSAIIFTGIGIFLKEMILDGGLREWIVGNMVTAGLPFYTIDQLKPDLYPPMFLAFALAFICVGMVIVRDARTLFMVSLLWLTFQAADIYHYRFMQRQLRTEQLNDDILRSIRWGALPWRDTRNPSSWTEDGRMEIIRALSRNYPVYNMVGNFVWRDYVFTDVRTDQWQQALDYYLRAYMRMPFDAPGLVNARTPNYLNYKMGDAAASKISAVTMAKVQVFEKAYYVSSPEAAAACLTHPQYAGDVIILSAYDGHPVRGRKDDPLDEGALAENKRFPAAYQVKLFSPNEVIIEVEGPSDRTSWLLYSDVWHPHWRATVNGAAAPVYAANLAYKAVELKPGKNLVRFYFDAPALMFFHWLFAIFALVLLFITGWALYHAFKDDDYHQKGLTA
jgi:hypothetical protein